MLSGSRQLKCSDKEIIEGTSHAPLQSPLEASSAAAINTCPAAMAGTVKGNAQCCLLQRKERIIGSHKYWLEGLLWMLQSSLLLPGNTWSVNCGFVQPSLLSVQRQTACCIFLTCGGSFQTYWCNSRNDKRTCKPTSSWVRHKISNSYHENIIRPRLCGSLTENKVHRTHLPATEPKSGLWTKKLYTNCSSVSLLLSVGSRTSRVAKAATWQAPKQHLEIEKALWSMPPAETARWNFTPMT